MYIWYNNRKAGIITAKRSLYGIRTVTVLLPLCGTAGHGIIPPPSHGEARGGELSIRFDNAEKTSRVKVGMNARAGDTVTPVLSVGSDALLSM